MRPWTVWGGGAHWEKKSSDERPRRRPPFERALRGQIIFKITNYDKIELQASTHHTRLVWLIFLMDEFTKANYFEILQSTLNFIAFGFPGSEPIVKGVTKTPHISFRHCCTHGVPLCIVFFFSAPIMFLWFSISPCFPKIMQSHNWNWKKKAKRGENPVASYSMGNKH